MMTESKTTEQLAEQWEKAMERAEQEAVRDQDLETEVINYAAGLQVKSGVKAGLWGDSKYCDH